ncbi:MAG: hypothetical protein KGS72_04520 [Cyanobacteria bacterium REEB67]|nr:hypothetical protein [Cyanobacteria bacterium REEB67]
MPNAKSKNPFSLLFNVFLYVCAGLFMPFWEAGKYLTKKTYQGSFVRGLLVSLTGLPVTAYGAYFVADVVGWTYNFSWPVWILAGALSAAIVGGIVWPALYLVVFKPIWDLVDKIFKLNRKVAENVVQPLSSALVGAVRHLPGADALWSVAEGKTKSGRKWGLKALTGVLGLGALAAGLAAFYLVFSVVSPLVPVFGVLPLLSGVFLSQIVAGALALTALVLSSGFLLQYIEYGQDKKEEESFTAVVYSAAITYGVSKLAFFGALSLFAQAPVALGVFVASLAYVLPSAIAILQGGLMEAFLKGWKKLLDAAYDSEEDKDYALFFAQVANICVALCEGLIAYFVAAAIHLPAVAMYAVAAVVALFSYASNPKDLTGTRRVTPLFGVGTAVGSGVLAYYFAPAAVTSSDFLHYAFGVGIAFFVGLVFYPFAYLALRFVTRPVAPSVGPALLAASAAADKAYKVVGDRLRKLQRDAFDDSSAYSGMFGHLFLLAMIGAAVFQGAPALYWTTIGTVGMAFWLKALVTAVAATNVYVLLAKLSSRYGAETFSLVSAAAAFLAVGQWALGIAAGNYWAAGVIGVCAAAVVGGLVAPVVYLVPRGLANVILTPWLAPLLKSVFDAIWTLYAGFWKRFASMLSFLRFLFAPFVAICVTVWAGMRAAYGRILGRK